MVEVCAFYIFQPLTAQDVALLKSELEAMSLSHNLYGLALIGREGLNFTFSGTPDGMHAFRAWLTARLMLEQPDFKISYAAQHPFQKFVVKVKKEIVTMGQPGVVPQSTVNGHISAQEWHDKLQSGEAIVLDTRNDYEVEIGKFKNAVDLDIREFQDFPARLQSAGLPKEREILIYCTGGIRCEKAMLEMKKQGFEKVHQLQGGILNYLKEFPDGEYDGECFVFDYRVALDQNLNPSAKYKLCTHCGQPSETELNCSLCHSTGVICHHCSGKGITTCSKNCEHHARLGRTENKPHLQEQRKRHRQ
jgi:UPF0176 protein